MGERCETWLPIEAIDDLAVIEVKTRYDEVFGPVMAGMINQCCWTGHHFHGSCDIIAYRFVPTPKP